MVRQASESVGARTIIQGGMGVGVSNWVLARAVAMGGQLGVVSGTAVDTVMVRRLQDGDVGGYIRAALEHFPLPDVSASALRRYFLVNGRRDGAPYKTLPMYKQVVSAERQRLAMLAGFVEVWLAKQGHDRPIGINLLTKVQMPNLATLYGAMLAGVDIVLMGAGIPREIPGVLDAFAEQRAASLKFDVIGAAAGETDTLTLDPRDHIPNAPALHRPEFIAIVSAHSLAATLARKANGHVDGFVIEGPLAGGHNAPPRGPASLNDRGEPLYGERDVVDLAKIRELELPFWIAGGVGSPEGLDAALAAGATGIQVGTLFAYCDESGLARDIKSRVLSAVRTGTVVVHTDPRASPTGYPFKVVEVGGIDVQSEHRTRSCDLGYLRTPYRSPEGKMGYRCSAEPVDAYVAKGGSPDDTAGRHCLCNGLLAAIGQPQERGAEIEKPLLPRGDDLVGLGRFLGDRDHYYAADVLEHLLSKQTASVSM